MTADSAPPAVVAARSLPGPSDTSTGRAAPQLADTKPVAPSAARSDKITALRTPVRLPPSSDPEVGRLTRSERIFLMHTGVQAQSLAIGSEGAEFLAFMDARYNERWASYNMNPAKSIKAAEVFNEYLDRQLKRMGKGGLERGKERTPQAVLKRLIEVEADIINRIVRKDFLTVAAKKRPAESACFLPFPAPSL